MPLPDSLPDGPCVVVVDQFEELYTDAGTEERKTFLKLLSGLLAEKDTHLHVLVTVRADHWDRPLADPEIGQAMADGALHLPPMDPGEIESTIVRPTELAGGRLEDGLVASTARRHDRPAGGASTPPVRNDGALRST